MGATRYVSLSAVSPFSRLGIKFKQGVAPRGNLFYRPVAIYFPFFIFFEGFHQEAHLGALRGV